MIPTSQSAIAEVRDQLSVDYADGKYLNVVSSNLGLQRPPFGFSDAVWRALVRVLGVQYKQIATKFEAVLEIILGPKITQCSAFATNVAGGSTYAVLVSTDNLPQVGTMVIDEGLPSEETVEYTFIDRYSNTVYFATPLTESHQGVGQVWESGIISDVPAAASFLSVYDAAGFPDPSVNQYTVCIGRGTAHEFAGPIVSVNFDARKLGVSFPPNGATGASSVAGMQIVQDGGPSQQNVYYLTMLDVERLLAEGGWLQSGDLTSTLTATAGSTTTVTVAGPLSVSRYGGFWIRFNGNVTAGLANRIAYVLDNTATVFTFGNTLPFAPAAGDTFAVLSNFQYIRANDADESVLMKRELPDLRQFPLNCQFSVMRPTSTVAIAQVQVKGTGWDVFQSDPHHVEILLPEEFLRNNLRSASYIRAVNQLAGFLPSNLTPPAISGTILIGNSLTITPGTWTGAPTLTYTLLRDGVPVGGLTNVSEAVLEAYALVDLDIGPTLTVRESDSVSATDATSNNLMYDDATHLPLTAIWVSTEGVGLVGGAVDTWASSYGGLSCTLTAIGAGNRPAYNATGGVGSRPLITTDGVDDVLAGTITLGGNHTANEYAITGSRVGFSALGDVWIGYNVAGLRYALRDRTVNILYNGAGTSSILAASGDPDGNNQRWWATRDLATTTAALGFGATTTASSGAATVVSYADSNTVSIGADLTGTAASNIAVQAADFGVLLNATQRTHLRALLTYLTGIAA